MMPSLKLIQFKIMTSPDRRPLVPVLIILLMAPTVIPSVVSATCIVLVMDDGLKMGDVGGGNSLPATPQL